MQGLFKAIDKVTPALLARSWRLLKTADAEFVTCDRPVGITLSDPEMRTQTKADLWSPHTTHVTFPLNRNLMLFGASPDSIFGASIGPTYEDRRAVANLNSRTISMTNRFVCWSGGELLWISKERTVANADQLLEAFGELARTTTAPSE